MQCCPEIHRLDVLSGYRYRSFFIILGQFYQEVRWCAGTVNWNMPDDHLYHLVSAGVFEFLRGSEERERAGAVYWIDAEGRDVYLFSPYLWLSLSVYVGLEINGISDCYHSSSHLFSLPESHLSALSLWGNHETKCNHDYHHCPDINTHKNHHYHHQIRPRSLSLSHNHQQFYFHNEWNSFDLWGSKVHEDDYQHKLGLRWHLKWY